MMCLKNKKMRGGLMGEQERFDGETSWQLNTSSE